MHEKRSLVEEDEDKQQERSACHMSNVACRLCMTRESAAVVGQFFRLPRESIWYFECRLEMILHFFFER